MPRLRPFPLVQVPPLPGLGAILLGALLAATLSGAADDEDDAGGLQVSESWRRLASLPREQRLALAQNLRRFDRLPASDRQAVRDLDGRLAACEPADRSRYMALLRRYHLWYRNLSDAQRDALKKAGPDERLTLAVKYRESQPKSNLDLPFRQFVRPTNFIQIESLQHWAYHIKVWQALTPAKRQVVLKPAKASERHKLLDAAGEDKNEHEGPFVSPVTIPLTRLDALQKKLESIPAARMGIAFNKADTLKDVQHRKHAADLLLDALYLADEKPKPVTPERLRKFQSDIPGWLLEPLDPLPPDDATRRLLVLYRLAYPDKNEVPDHPPADPAAKVPAKAAPIKPPVAAGQPF